MYVYLMEDNQLGKIRTKLEYSIWEGFKCIYQPFFLQVSPEDATAAHERVLEELQVTKNQIVKFILDYSANPHLKLFMKPFLDLTNGFYSIFKWLRVVSTISLQKLSLVCDDFPTRFCTRVEEKLLQICQTITQHLPTLGLPQLLDLEYIKSFISEALEGRLLPAEVEGVYAQQLAQVIAQLEQDEQLYKGRSREELIKYIQRFVKASEDYINKSLDCIKPDFKGNRIRYTIWRYIDEAREEAKKFNKM